MNDFPRMIYKAGGPEQIHGGRFHTLIVHDADEMDAALSAGWSMTTPEAVDAAKPQTEAIPDDDSAPTRAELKRKADELGLQYPANIPTERLAAMVEAALKV